MNIILTFDFILHLYSLRYAFPICSSMDLYLSFSIYFCWELCYEKFNLTIYFPFFEIWYISNQSSQPIVFPWIKLVVKWEEYQLKCLILQYAHYNRRITLVATHLSFLSSLLKRHKQMWGCPEQKKWWTEKGHRDSVGGGWNVFCLNCNHDFNSYLQLLKLIEFYILNKWHKN